MVKLGSAIKNQVAMGQKDNDIIKRNADYSLNAFITKDNKKNMRQSSAKIKYAKNSLLDKIISSNLNENAINKRLEQISYSAINGQRQTEGTYKPEGVQMLGQLGREKPLEAITKEMIQEYQEEDQRPFIVDGEARKYAKADYEPILQLPQSLDDIKDDLKKIYKNKVATAKTIKDAEEYLKTAIEYYKGLLRDINVFGMTDAKRKEKEQTEQHIRQERMKYDQLRNQMDVYEYEIKRLFDEGKEIKRLNALIPERNREEVTKYEQSLLQHNRNRLNIQQLPNESEMEYYQRLREVERTKMDPVLYKQYSINKASKELKPKLGNLFKDEGQIEEVIKSLSENDKFIVNKNFDRVEKDFIDKYGYNPSMNTKMAINAILEPFASSSSRIKDLIKRKNAQDLYIPDLKEEHQKQAFQTLQGVFKRKKNEPKIAEVLKIYREKDEAASKIKAAIKRNENKPGIDAMKLLLSKRIAAKKTLEDTAAQQAQRKYDVALSRDRQQQRMDELVSQKKAQQAAAVAEAQQAAAAAEAQQAAAAALEKRKQNTEKIKEQIRRTLYKTDFPINQEVLDKFVNDHIQNKLDARAKRLYSSADANEKDLMRQMIKNLYIKKLVPLSATDVITKSLKETKTKADIMQSVRKAIEAKQKEKQDNADRLVQLSIEAQQRGQMQEPSYISTSPELSPTSQSMISAATTVAAEQMLAGLRKPRSDLGSTKAPYVTKKKMEIELQKKLDSEFYETLTPDELKYFKSKKRLGGKTVTTILNEIRKQREGPKGSGVRRPPKRQVKINPEEKKKNRLQLVIAQIKAGNTNPKLILEVNKLYKSLYDIDNAYMMLK
jgi:hypothetical protein